MLWNMRKRFSPPYDVIETKEQIIVLVEVAGMQADDFNIRRGDDKLVMHGTRHRQPFDNCAYHRVEIGFGEFRVQIPITWSIQQNIVNAVYRDGFLKIELPRLPEQQIQIISMDGNEQDNTHHES